MSWRSETKDPYLYNTPPMGQGSSIYGAAGGISGMTNMSAGVQGLSLYQAGMQGRSMPTSQQFLPRVTGSPSFTNIGISQMSGSTGFSTASGTRGSLPMRNQYGINQTQGLMSSMSSITGGFGDPVGSQRGLDISDFSSIVRPREPQGTSILPYKTVGYGIVGHTAKPPEPAQEFQIENEDFPALPGTATTKNNEMAETSNEKRYSSISALPEVRNSFSYDPTPGPNKEKPVATPIGPPKGLQKKSVTQSAITVPPGMVQDQFGMMGLLTFIRAAETDPNLVALALGSDLTTLGLNLNSPESLYNTFASPWADSPCRPQDIDFNVPQEYLIHTVIKDKLANIQLKRYGEDLLFYLYYSNGGDLLQLLASIELYNRDWRYHKEEKVWITRAPGIEPGVKTPNYEKGTYYFFEVNQWRKILKDFLIEYDKLEEKPQLPPTFGTHHTGSNVPTQT